MPNKSSLVLAVLILSTLVFLGFKNQQDGCQPLTRTQMKEKLDQLGYVVTDIETQAGKEKYSVMLNKGGLDIPVGAEISPNNRFIWLTVNLGNPRAASDTMNNTLLKQHAKIQPCQFYITSRGLLMMGLPVENKGVTNAYLRDRLESIAGNVADTKAYWQK